jgi:hypothetical protein
MFVPKMIDVAAVTSKFGSRLKGMLSFTSATERTEDGIDINSGRSVGGISSGRMGRAAPDNSMELTSQVEDNTGTNVSAFGKMKITSRGEDKSKVKISGVNSKKGAAAVSGKSSAGISTRSVSSMGKKTGSKVQVSQASITEK